jgi:hypothetical protein
MEMDEDKVARWGLLAGVVFVVLILVAGFLAGSPPKLTDSNTKIVKFFRDNQDQLRIASYLYGIAGVVFLWFLGSLFGRLRRAEGGSGRLAGVALTAGVVAVAVQFVYGGIAGFTALHPETAAGGYRLATDLGAYVNFAAAAFTAAVSVVLWSKGVLPKVLGYAGEAIAVGLLVAAAAVATESDTVFTIGFIVFLVWIVWLAVVSVMLYRTPEKA